MCLFCCSESDHPHFNRIFLEDDAVCVGHVLSSGAWLAAAALKVRNQEMGPQIRGWFWFPNVSHGFPKGFPRVCQTVCLIWGTAAVALQHLELAECPVKCWHLGAATARFMRRSSSVTLVDMEAGVLNPGWNQVLCMPQYALCIPHM